ncbi:MAG: hypothetical protein JNM27_11580 [Leptospirales bacterium]|nr:hypothetical protein [Leptospirales bacterium]
MEHRSSPRAYAIPEELQDVECIYQDTRVGATVTDFSAHGMRLAIGDAVNLPAKSDEIIVQCKGHKLSAICVHRYLEDTVGVLGLYIHQPYDQAFLISHLPSDRFFS